jgi:twitching motility protein PilT
MSAVPSDLLGRLAVHYRLINMDQLAAAVKEQVRNPGKKLGAIMVELEMIDVTQLAQLLEAQRQYIARHDPESGDAAPPARSSSPRAAAIAPPPPRTNDVPAAAKPQPATNKAKPGTAPQPQVPDIAASPARLEWLHRVLERAREADASDVHIHAGAAIKARIHGMLSDMTPEVLPSKEAESVLLSTLNRAQRERVYEDGQIDFTYVAPNIGRFRANVYREARGLCGVFHYIPTDPPLLSDLGLPNAAAKLVNHSNGIVLITGPAGSGKTSTMAALVNLINEERTDHVLSIEDPIEYLHPSKRCIVNQRQVNRDTHTFSAALKSALREDPDIICIGELRDLETISLALSAAETGHLVIGTLHTQGAVRTINRIVGAYPSAQQSQVRTMLSESLRAIISQKLVVRADGAGMALAYELLMINVAAANLIRENRAYQLNSVMQIGRGKGMRSMDESLQDLVKRGIIHRHDAAQHADDPRLFLAREGGGHSST